MMKVFLDRGVRKLLVSKVDAVFNFEIKSTKQGPVIKTFVIDLKNGNEKVINFIQVYVGNDKNSIAVFTMIDEDFEKVCMGTMNL